MAYGVRVISDSGYTQIDENFSNYHLYATGSTNSFAGIPFYGSDQIELIRIPYGGQFGYDYDSYNSTIEFRIYRLSQFVGGSGTHGLRVYNASGALQFDSNQKVMKVFSISNISTDSILALPYGGSIVLSNGTGQRPWVNLAGLGVIEFTTMDGGAGNISSGVGPVIRQNYDNTIGILCIDGVTGGPPVEYLRISEGARTFMLGE